MDLDALLSQDGPLAARIPGYRVRSQQQEMARAVQDAIAGQGVLVAEAGTGTGKTLAYLVPALLSGGRVILSTGTKTLQDQLFERDIPAVREALGVPVTVAVLKGRANYVCPHHLQRHLEDGRFLRREDIGHLRAIARYAAVSDSGDRAGLGQVPEQSPAWALATSTRENCLGGDCPRLRECFVMEARRRALAAELVVVNHHLFFADLWLRDEGAAELLPRCNTVIFDEAHQLPATARLFFGESLGTGQLLDLARDARVEAAAVPDFPLLAPAAQAVDLAAQALRRSVGEAGRGASMRAQALERVGGTCLDALDRDLAHLDRLLASQAQRSEDLARCSERAAQALARLRRWRAAPPAQDTAAAARWVEVHGNALNLHLTPLSVAPLFRRQIGEGARAWVFTSATLAVRGDFSHYLREMGLEAAATGCWESPFHYPGQALLYLPGGLPEPNHPEFAQAAVEAMLGVLEASGGRAFLLFTSLRAMREAQPRVVEGLQRLGLEVPVLFQDEAPRRELLERFRALGNAVLVASQSFFEGVDVPGDALSVVAVDRLPFAAPDDPVLAARLEAHTAAGGNAFMDIQVPEAAIVLKQAAGRLIRTETDRGVLVICDPRLAGRPYGRRIWQSLPPMRRTRDLAEVQAFFALPPPA